MAVIETWYFSKSSDANMACAEFHGCLGVNTTSTPPSYTVQVSNFDTWRFYYTVACTDIAIAEDVNQGYARFTGECFTAVQEDPPLEGNEFISTLVLVIALFVIWILGISNGSRR